MNGSLLQNPDQTFLCTLVSNILKLHAIRNAFTLFYGMNFEAGITTNYEE
jgi:hypothetical protein